MCCENRSSGWGRKRSEITPLNRALGGPTLDDVSGKPKLRNRVTALVVATLGIVLAGCSAGHWVLLDVHFQPGTSSRTASSVLHYCGRGSTVWRIDTPFGTDNGTLAGGIWTHSGSTTDPAIQAILTCLNGTSSVTSVTKGLLSLRPPVRN